MSKSSHVNAPPLAKAKRSGKSAGNERKFGRESIIAGDRHSKLAEAAYVRAEQRGFAPGHELEDWLAAEPEIDQQLGSSSD